MSVIVESRLLHDQQHGAGVDRLAFGDRDVAHAAIAGGAQLVLHLHRFDDDQALAGLTSSPGFTSTRTTLPGIGATIRCGPAAARPAPSVF